MSFFLRLYHYDFSVLTSICQNEQFVDLILSLFRISLIHNYTYHGLLIACWYRSIDDLNLIDYISHDTHALINASCNFTLIVKAQRSTAV